MPIVRRADSCAACAPPPKSGRCSSCSADFCPSSPRAPPHIVKILIRSRYVSRIRCACHLFHPARTPPISSTFSPRSAPSAHSAFVQRALRGRLSFSLCTFPSATLSFPSRPSAVPEAGASAVFIAVVVWLFATHQPLYSFSQRLFAGRTGPPVSRRITIYICRLLPLWLRTIRPRRAASQFVFVVSCRSGYIRSSKLIWPLFPSLEDERPSPRLALPSDVARSWAALPPPYRRSRSPFLCSHRLTPSAPSRRPRPPSSTITPLCDNPALTQVHGPHRSGAWRSSFSSQLLSSSLFTQLPHCVACRSVSSFALPHSLHDPTSLPLR